MNLFHNLFNKKKKERNENQLLVEFLRKKREVLEKEMDRSMLKYLDEFVGYVIKLEGKDEKKKLPIKSWISRELEIDQENKRSEEEEENKLPHPIVIKPKDW